MVVKGRRIGYKIGGGEDIDTIGVDWSPVSVIDSAVDNVAGTDGASAGIVMAGAACTNGSGGGAGVACTNAGSGGVSSSGTDVVVAKFKAVSAIGAGKEGGSGSDASILTSEELEACGGTNCREFGVVLN